MESEERMYIVVLATASKGIFLKLDTAKTLPVRKVTYVMAKNPVDNTSIKTVS